MEDLRFYVDVHIDDRALHEVYASFFTSICTKIRSGEATMEELAAYAAHLGSTEGPGSGCQEYLESVVN